MWDDEYEKVQGLLRDIVKKLRNEHLKTAWRIIPAHKRLQSRLDQIRKYVFIRYRSFVDVMFMHTQKTQLFCLKWPNFELNESICQPCHQARSSHGATTGGHPTC